LWRKLSLHFPVFKRNFQDRIGAQRRDVYNSVNFNLTHHVPRNSIARSLPWQWKIDFVLIVRGASCVPESILENHDLSVEASLFEIGNDSLGANPPRMFPDSLTRTPLFEPHVSATPSSSAQGLLCCSEWNHFSVCCFRGYLFYGAALFKSFLSYRIVS
jgi:hypothetical protein